jgi:hypothetical protein
VKNLLLRPHILKKIIIKSPLPLFAKEGHYSYQWEREGRRDLMNNQYVFNSICFKNNEMY